MAKKKAKKKKAKKVSKRAGAARKKVSKKRGRKKSSRTAGCPPAVAVEIKNLADKNAALSAEVGRLRAAVKKKVGKKVGKKRGKKRGKKKASTASATSGYRYGKFGRVYPVSAAAPKKASKKRGSKKSAGAIVTASQIEKGAKSRSIAAWICANASGRRTGCGGGRRGGHVVASTSISPAQLRAAQKRRLR